MHQNLKRLRALAATVGLLLAAGAQAQTPSVMPRADQIRPAYSSTWLLLDPCHDFAKEAKEDNVDAESLKEQKTALADFPQGVCARAGMAEKLFQSRFLQYASLAQDAQPWQLWPKILQQQSRMKACKTLDCLERELDASIAQLKPLYLAPQQQASSAFSLCKSAMKLMPIRKALALLPAGERQSVLRLMGSAGHFEAQICSGKDGRLLSLTERMSGNQVNGSEWLYQLPTMGQATKLLYVEDGPVMALPSNCAGRADLMSSARVNAGEHDVGYYRFDGRQYQLLMSFMQEAVAVEEQAGDWTIARDVEYKPQRCQP